MGRGTDTVSKTNHKRDATAGLPRSSIYLIETFKVVRLN